MRNVILTALAPIFWGTTYLIATELLPERPFFVAIMRALPVGVAMILIYRKLPRGKWWWRMFVLGGLNIGLFFALLFVAAYRIPGGVVATIGAIQPLIVLLIAWLLLGNQLLPLAIAAAGGGILGVGMLVFSPTAQFDVIGILAAVGAALVMAGGTVLTKHWGRPVPLLLFTAWQLTAGGIILIPLAVVFEQPLPTATATNLIGYAWLGVVNTAFAYVLWFRGIERLRVTQVTFLVLLSPVVAVIAGFLVLGQSLDAVQITGMMLVLVSVGVSQRSARLSFSLTRTS